MLKPEMKEGKIEEKKEARSKIENGCRNRRK